MLYEWVSYDVIIMHIIPYDFLYIYFSIPFIIFVLLFSLAPSRNSDPGSHSRFFFPPTHYGSCLAFFFAVRFQLFASNCTYPR